MLIYIFNVDGVLYKEFLPPSKTVNGRIYCDVVRRIKENIQDKRPDKWRNNAPSHLLCINF